MEETAIATRSQMTALRFDLGFRQGVAPMLLIAAFMYLIPVEGRVVAAAPEALDLRAWLAELGAFGLAMPEIAKMLWVCALCSFPFVPRCIPVLWCFGMSIFSWLMMFLFQAAFALGWAIPEFQGTGVDYGQLGEWVLPLLSFSLLGTVLALVSSAQRRYGLALAVAIGIGFVLSSFQIDTGLWGLTALLKLSSWVEPPVIPLGTLWHSFNGEISLWFGPYSLEFPCPEELSLMAAAVPLAVLAAHYYVISIILRKFHPRQA